MQLLTLVLIIIGSIIAFEFVKHKFVKTSAKWVLILAVIVVVGLLASDYASSHNLSSNGAVQTGASIVDSIRDTMSGVDIQSPLPAFNTRKAYIGNS